MRTLLIGALMILSFGSFTNSSSRSSLTYYQDYSGVPSFNFCNQRPGTFSGSILYVITEQANGRYRVLAKPQDLTFTDVTGEIYKAAGVTSFQYDLVESTLTLVNNMLFIGEKGGSKMLMNQRGTAYVLPDGSLITLSQTISLRCP